MGKNEDDGGAVCGAACLLCVIILVALGLAGLGITEIVIGAKYIHDCSLQKMIPIYLIVDACSRILFVWLCKKSGRDEGTTLGSVFEGTIIGNICESVFGLFQLAWLICGTIWIYPTYVKVNQDTSYVPCKNDTSTPPGCTEGTCNDTLLNFSFSMVTLGWIFMAISIYIFVNRRYLMRMRDNDGGGTVRCCGVLCGVAFCLGLIGVGIAEMIIGIEYLDDCSIQEMIPIYLFVSACAPTLYIGLCIKTRDNERFPVGSVTCGIIALLFNFAWLICGTVWVYPTYAMVNKDTYVPCEDGNGTLTPTDSSTLTPTACTERTCNDVLLKFSFAMVTIDWVCLGFWIVIITCVICSVRDKSSESMPVKGRLISKKT